MDGWLGFFWGTRRVFRSTFSPQVLKQLRSKYGELYRQDNVILSGTHTHSGPGGYFQYTLFWITSKGLVQPTLKSIVNGIVKVGVTQFRVLVPSTALAGVLGVAPACFEVGLLVCSSKSRSFEPFLQRQLLVV